MKSQTEQDVYRKLLMLMVRSKREFARILEQKYLTPAQGMLMMCLEEDESRTMNDLADMFGCDASNITGLVDKLEAQEMICRTADKKDRRIKKICLSKKGCECRNFMLDGLKKSEAVDMSKLSTEEQAQLNVLITKLVS